MRHRLAIELGLRALFLFVAVAPLLPVALARLPLLGSLGAALDAWFVFQCERDPARTFAGVDVCARCFGIYLGFGLGGALGLPALSLRAVQRWIAGASALLLLDVASEELGYRPAWAALRVATGLLLAYPVGLIVKAALVPAPPPLTSRS
jgi:uncharacterized membrane protein